MSTIAHDRINDILRTNEGEALVPILKRFEAQDPISYQQIGIALWEAYKAGINATQEIVEKAVNS